MTKLQKKNFYFEKEFITQNYEAKAINYFFHSVRQLKLTAKDNTLF
jgi:hypothetical protein